MCKYCESEKEHNLVTYSNADSMNISYGTRQGVLMYSYLSMLGNMLLVRGSGNYRSKFDCYYESWDLDCDGENATESDAAYIGIKYCPFCGRKLDSTLYEKTYAKDRIKELEHKISEQKDILGNEKIFIQFRWKGVHKDNYNKNPLSIEELFNAYSCEAKIHYGFYFDSYMWGKPEDLEELYMSTKIIDYSGSRLSNVSEMFILNDDMLNELASKGFISIDEQQLRSVKEYNKELENIICKEQKEIEDLKKKLETYK